jgi:anti-sigma factor RsiW
MKCDDAQELVTERLSGTLDPAAGRALAGHLAGCVACRAEERALAAVWSDLGSLPVELPGPELRAAFYADLEERIDSAAGRGAEPAARRLAGWQRWAAAAALLAAGFAGGWGLGNDAPERREVAELRHELDSLSALVLTTLLDDPRATERLRGVHLSRRYRSTEGEVTLRLLELIEHDSNVNVRLAALDVLARNARRPEIGAALADTLPHQRSPLVQIALADALIDSGSREVAAALRDLVASPTLDRSVREYLAGRIPTELDQPKGEST